MAGLPEKIPRQVGDFSYTVDELGQAVVVEIDATLFELSAIFKTCYWATEHAFLYMKQDKAAGIIHVEMRTKTTDNADLETVAREFCNALIDHQTRQIVLKETSAERDVLLAKAFGAAQGHINPDNIS